MILMRGLLAVISAIATLIGAIVVPPVTDTAAVSGMSSAVHWASSHGYTTGIAVADTTTGRIYVGGHSGSAFPSESVVKVLIATEILLHGKMHGSVETTAYKMITQSDDQSADNLYGLSGGDQTIDNVEAHYHINIGYPPGRVGRWGNTHLYPLGLARFYLAVRHDPRVWPWLYHAMSHAHQYGSDGTYQFFGIPSAVKAGFAVKQGWGLDDDCYCHADYNTTGYLDGGRYAVVILSSGPSSAYHVTMPHAVTEIAKHLLPGGRLTLS